MMTKMNRDQSSTTTDGKGMTMDMIHSEDELLHALRHLLGSGEGIDGEMDTSVEGGTNLEGHETMVLYRNVRKKYSSDPSRIKDGLQAISTFRTPERGLEAAYRAALCRDGPEREASALYVTINPRNVAQGMARTQAHYMQWMENKVGLSKELVKGMHRQDFVGTMDMTLNANILRSQSRRNFDMIDVDDPTWLPRVREAIGDDNIEMILETKSGYHVVYRGKQLKKEEHKRLQNVLMESPKGQMAKAERGKGSCISCALPGGSQSYHKTKIVYCACERKTKGPKIGDIVWTKEDEKKKKNIN